MCWRLVLLLCGGLLNICVAQEKFHYTLRNYSPADGLPQSQVNALVEDQNGYLWIGTEGGGLARFDGREFKVYTTLDGLLTNFVLGLRIDSQHNLWILHPRGVSRFNGLDFTKFELPGTSSSSQRLRRMLLQNDTVFAVSASGALNKIHGDSVYYWDKPVLQDHKIYFAHETTTGDLCFLTEDGDLFVKSFDEAFFIRPTTPIQKVFNVYNRGEEVWIRTERGTFALNIKERSVNKVKLHFDHYVLAYDEKLNVYWTRNGNTLFKETITEDGVKRDTVVQDIEVLQVLNDAEGNYWFASYGRGLYKYFIQDFDKCSSENLRGVMAVHVDRYGERWVGSMSKGLWKIKNGNIRHFHNSSEPYRNHINSIGEAPDGTLWVTTKYGVGRYDREREEFIWYTRKDGLSSNIVLNMEFDKNGGIWFGTNMGLNYFDGNRFVHYTTANGLSSNGVWAMEYLDSILYVGNEFGLNTVHGGNINHVKLPGLDNTMIISMHSFRDSLLLIGTGGSGIVFYDPIDNHHKSITSRDGLTSDFVYFAAPEGHNTLWIGSEKGITRLKIDERFGIIENLHYDQDNGLSGVETNQNAFYLDGDDKYFGLIDGLYQFNDHLNNTRGSFDLHLTNLQLLYGEYAVRDYADSLVGFFKIPSTPFFPTDKNHLTFHFNRVDKRYPKSVKFRYYLENFDKTWSQPSSRNEVTYSNLPPGEYVFRVKATNNQGSWDENEIAYAFTIQTPFYQRASFIIAMIILFAGTITLILYMRVRNRVKGMIERERIRQREQESIRKEIARDFHDEMGNQLTRIINYISLMKLKNNGSNGLNGSHSDLYTKIEESAKYLYTGTRDFIWSIDPGNEELSKLFIHIRDFGEKLFEEKGIKFRAFNEVKELVKLPYGFSREANLIFKEVMTNAFKYSEACNVSLSLKHHDSDYELVFEDDGVGFCAEQTTKQNGLINIRERAQRIGANLRVSSVQKAGTSVVLKFKLQKRKPYGVTI